MLLVDGHTNLGTHPRSKNKNSVEHKITPGELDKHLNHYGVTHHLCLYEQTKPNLLVQLKSKAKVYACQAMYATTPEQAYEIDRIPLHVGNYKDVVGVKFHSHRGYWNIDGNQQTGFDYSDTKTIARVLDRLPEHSIVSMHTQGTASLNNTSTPLAIAHLAVKYPELRFIINHAGDYGATGYRPSPDKLKRMDNVLPFIASLSLVRQAMEVCDALPNVFLDTSVIFLQKASILTESTRWVIGSDIPYNVEETRSLTNQRKLAARFGVGEERLQQQEMDFINFVEGKFPLTYGQMYGKRHNTANIVFTDEDLRTLAKQP